MDCIWHGRRLAFGSVWISDLPVGAKAVLENGSADEFLETLAELALDPAWTFRIASQFEPLLVDFCNRWLANEDGSGTHDFRAFCAICRLLPLHPSLATYARQFALIRRRGVFQHLGSGQLSLSLPESVPDDGLGPLLLCIYRCLRHDTATFSPLFHGPQIQTLLKHEQRYIRYLALKILCTYLKAADAAFHPLLGKYVSPQRANGPWDNLTIDYRYLDLWEKRAYGLYNECKMSTLDGMTQGRSISLSDLHGSTIVVGRSIQPTANPSTGTGSTLVPTPTTMANLEKFGASLTKDQPILLTGRPGSGKSALVRDVSRMYSKDDTMLTLHLNEQTDAKLLIGMYTSSGAPGSFKWQAGVLTTAVREGRWVLIEDLDRAPAEVMSALLPLMERRQLYVPNLGGSISAHPDFRLFATIRSSVQGAAQREITPNTGFLGARHWSRLHLEMLGKEDLQEIISVKYPLLASWSDNLLNIYEVLHDTSAVARKLEPQTTAHRTLSPQDLLKCCGRVSRLLSDSGSHKGSESVSETLHNHIFLEIIDCFASFIPTVAAREHVTSIAAQRLQISPQRKEHCLSTRVPRRHVDEKRVTLGRVTMKRRQQPNSGRIDAMVERPFAYTNDVLRKMEALAAAVRSGEPCLLVGETGTGKTTAVQELAKITGQKLIVVNLSQQSEAGDLLGGYKPLNLRSFSTPLKDDFDDLFAQTVTLDENEKFLKAMNRAFAKSEYDKLLKLWRQAVEIVRSRFTPKGDQEANPAKRRKLEKSRREQLRARWEDFSQRLNIFESHVKSGGKGFAFHFVEGNIVKAVRHGDWVLLDEINLASPDTLESLADLLTDHTTEEASLVLTETGDVERVCAHPDFRIFGAMNPATDVGKRDLPLSIRSRFTEYYMSSPDSDPQSLLQIVQTCLGNYAHQDSRAAQNITNLYLNIVKLEQENKLVDGANTRPHYSLRTLTRTLAYVLEIAPLYGLRRSLYEGFSMSFLTLLNQASADLVYQLIEKHILPNERERKSLLKQMPPSPNDGRKHVAFEQYWLRQGPQEPRKDARYIITKFIRANLLNLVRAASTRRFPVLLQGPTSSGKTSMVEYLAKISGNSFVRINNHEHTDLQEYLGTYITDNEGNLRFQEGVLVQALRQGHWIVLDELNLAPTDILEALNRLLDDNRELLIPETQEIVRPHENFMLFATQNPAGLYGGRKALSRAFRNRFLELHFDDIPEDELEEILEQRTQIAPSFAKNIIQIYRRLAELRQSSRLFEQKNSFATLRDLFRWALRDIATREELAIHGYMLLAERVRDEEEREAVRKAIQQVTKVKTLDPPELYRSLSSDINNASEHASGIVWTPSMQRVYALVTEALKRNEPVLLVGGTGCGKTSVCQVIAELAGTQLHIVNAHQNTETGDLIGAQRPIRNRSAIESELNANLSVLFQGIGQTVGDEEATDAMMKRFCKLDAATLQNIPPNLLAAIRGNMTKYKSLFEWSDGSLVQAMKDGTHFLLDEISLAEDSVLERLNSVLEPSRTILLAEKGPTDATVTAASGFQFLATMNPGGDFGKRELSPALRNRFTEIWVPPMSSKAEIAQISQAKLNERYRPLASKLVDFAFWFGQRFNPSGPSLSIRDVLAWVYFMNTCSHLDAHIAVLEGAAMVYIDALGANPSAGYSLTQSGIVAAREESLQKLSTIFEYDMVTPYFAVRDIQLTSEEFHVGRFKLSRKPGAEPDKEFSLQAPTTISNMARITRALQLNKPILMEGSPGVGKTTLVAALAKAIGVPLTRINLSEQTDLMDLFGSDVPVEGGEAGQFAWRDAPFLQAMKRGQWVLLDEMNLASQSVLEGLNACLDHRGEVFIPELDQTFTRHPGFTIFAAQNPHSQGGGRKGLPASFVNRFTVTYADALDIFDLIVICSERFPSIKKDIIQQVIQYVVDLSRETQASSALSGSGGPWEFNLRDILRWLNLLSSMQSPTSCAEPEYFSKMLFQQRFRSNKAKEPTDWIVSDRDADLLASRSIYRNLSPLTYQAGLAILPRSEVLTYSVSAKVVTNARTLESVMLAVTQNWPVLLVGPSGSGKTSLLHHIAAMVGTELLELPLSADMDTMDIVGGYEQADPLRLLGDFRHIFQTAIRTVILQQDLAAQPEELWSFIENQDLGGADLATMESFLENVTSNLCDQAWHDLLKRCRDLQKRLSQDLRARFEWTDGLLVKALQTGKWLVLDNANLCSSSVLDRLNSLLEPNGFLSINEHKLSDGSARIVRPHSNFRIFLTMDPRHGELSRAMRNRCLELFMPVEPVVSAPQIPVEITDSSLFRLQALSHQRWSTVSEAHAEPLLSTAFDHLAFSDTSLLDSFSAQVRRGLMPSPQFLASPLCNLEAQVAFAVESTAFRQTILSTYKACLSQLSLGGDILVSSESIHPMNNSMLLSLARKLPATDSTSDTTSVLHEIGQAIYILSNKLQRRQHDLANGTVQATSRLDRSLVADKVLAFSKDTTAPLGRMLVQTLSILRKSTIAQSGQSLTSHELRPVKTYLDFLSNLFEIAFVPGLDDPTFQAYLTVGRKALQIDSTSSSIQAVFKESLSQLSLFRSSCQLNTGLGMKFLWSELRPQRPLSQARRDLLWRLEGAMVQLDKALSGTSVPYTQLVLTRNRIRDIYHSLCVEYGEYESVQQVLLSIEGFTTQVRQRSQVQEPHFRESFQSLAQLVELFDDARSGDSALEVASCRPIESLAQMHEASPLCRKLYRTQRSTGMLLDERPLQAVKGSVLPLVITELNKMRTVPMTALDTLQNELRELPKAIANICAFSTHDPLAKLNQQLIDLSGNFWQLLDSQTLDQESMQTIRAVVKKYIPIQQSDYGQNSNKLHEAMARTAAAWIKTFVGLLLLYVPDQAFDPALESTVLIANHRRRKLELERKLKALEIFEEMSGHTQLTPRIRALSSELAALGEEPPSSGVFRPEESRIAQLAGYFSNILETIVGKCVDLNVGGIDDSAVISGLSKNVESAITRLHTTFRDYDDIVQPAIQLLIGLRIGLKLAETHTEQQSKSIEMPTVLRLCAPTMGSNRQNLLSIRSKDFKRNLRNTAALQILSVQAMAVDRQVTGIRTPRYLTMAQQIFDDRYSVWSRQLAKEQKDHATKSSLYQYRGLDQIEEDDESAARELRSLFPTYDDDSDEDKSQPVTTRLEMDPALLARKLADVHGTFFVGLNGPEESFESLIQSSNEQVVSFLSSQDPTLASSIPGQQVLPSVILVMHDQIQSLVPKTQTASYNFYRDANIDQVQVIRQLSDRLRTRFEAIHAAWPEQASPLDVLRVISELMQLAHTDPVAKILTKAEQLHNYVYQWEQVASREFSAAALYTELTDLLVSWRRLELSSWATVLNVEDAACADDAKSWWFIAYETIIAASLSVIANQGDLKQHVQGLMETLIQFMRTTCRGQFRQRVRMIQVFQLHVAALSEQQEELSSLSIALRNFVAYYQRFQSSIDEQLKVNRDGLEKKMKEVILISSWKDTNIEALRTSSRVSHTRLFRIIRKYRAVLAEPVESLLAQDAPFHPEAFSSYSTIADTLLTMPSETSITKLKQAFPNSESLPPRFINVSQTLGTMRSICRIPDAGVDVAAYLHSWTENLLAASKELQRETPSKLTENNKSAVQHLKTRKRKVFADVLKDLRIMGLKTNIDTQTLEMQSSLAKVLTGSKSIPGQEAAVKYELEFFRVIDNLDQIRMLSREHSDDLASNEVSRSLVYMQGLVDLVIKQRQSLSKQAADLGKLDERSTTLCHLYNSLNAETLQLRSKMDWRQDSLRATARWLPLITRFSAKLLELHDQMGGKSTISVQVMLGKYGTDAESIAEALGENSQLPHPLSVTSELQAEKQLGNLLEKITASIAAWDTDCPSSRFATALVSNWLSDDNAVQVATNGATPIAIHEYQSMAVQFVDKILAALQNTAKILSTYPQDEEEALWFVRSVQILDKAVQALNMETIHSSLAAQFMHVADPDNPERSRRTASVCSFTYPFVAAYSLICRSLLKRSLQTHGATVRTTRILSESFLGLLKNGFCSPHDDSKGEKSGQDKLEEGTGLGEGEGAEDISKDIEDDEDLSELAQSKQEGENEEVEGEDNAVDMADQDLEGKMDDDGEMQEKDGEEAEGEDDEQGPEEELGDIGNDDPEAIDEKLWDGESKEESGQENKAEQQAGKKDDQMAAEGDVKEQDQEGEAQEELSDLEDDAEGGEEINDANLPALDPQLQEEEKLDLPDDIDMDADQKSIASESDLEGMDDMDDGKDVSAEAEIQPDTEPEPDVGDEGMPDEPDDNLQDGQDADLEGEPEEEEIQSQDRDLREQGDTAMDADDQLQGETDGLAGSGENADDAPEQQETQTGGTRGQSGTKDESQGRDETEDSSRQSGAQASGEAVSAEDSFQDSAEAEAFKKLGDALEKFHRGSKDIRQAAKTNNDKQQQQEGGAKEATEFEHLPNEDAANTEQALGNADDDQVRGLEEGAMDLDQVDAESTPADKPVIFTGEDEDKHDEKDEGLDDPEAMTMDAPNTSSIGQRQVRKDGTADGPQDVSDGEAIEEDDIQELDDGLSEVHLQPSVPDTQARSASDALALWQECELRTNSLAISLTEQLRLILEPTLATKMRGGFRTGKRLNIKSIIGYIASQYKRDKIWMRRSVPSKRAYQIMIAVDDSKSMDEPGSGSSRLAFETLALVSRSLSMLEAGQLCVLGFGQDVQVAHSFDQTFSSSVGANILQRFQFQQEKTDVKRLVNESLRLFREARAMNQSSTADLWQLEFIISDGIFEDPERVLQLVRQAHQERVMIVFIIVDALKGTSISSLQQASYEKNAKTGEMEVKMKRYLADFPFDYYLIVGDVEELPAVLATALRQWFSEIADT